MTSLPAMQFATGALGTLLPKLTQLLYGEYKLQKNVRRNIVFIKKELETTQAALHSVGEVPIEQLTGLVRIWGRDARELSYDMEDVVDAFLVHVQGPDPPSKRTSKRFIRKMKGMLALVGMRHNIGKQIEDIKERVVELAARRDRYKVDTVNHVESVDPRIQTLYAKTTELVGIVEARKEIIMKLETGDSSHLQKIVSIVGFAGLGKTTLAKAVHEEMKLKFNFTAFVTVSRNPDMKKFLKDMLYALDKQEYRKIHSTSLDVTHLLDLTRELISNKRYFIVIDDIWDISNWDIIKCALPDDNHGSGIITTTRNVRVAKYIGGAYEMKPLTSDSSKVLLYRRIFGNEDLEKYLNEEMVEASDKILKKCAGVPLAIITIASLLANKGRNKIEWDEVYNSIGNGMENSLDAENMRKILSYSYYDLPSHLRTCLFYLCMFPEDFGVGKYRLIWLWIAEGFIQCEKQGKSAFELGESYFNELINRSMIQPLYDDFYNTEIHSCQVHDAVRDLICSVSSEENFVTVFSNMDQMSTPTTVRRLFIHQCKFDHGATWGTRSLPQARTFVVFSSVVDQLPSLLCFKVLRVLDLIGSDLSKGYNLKDLGNLSHLRYLNLRHTSIAQLPKEVGKLQFLETLDVTGDPISCLPLSIAELKNLMCLSIDSVTKVPNVIGSLKSLEELSYLLIDEDSRDNVEALGLLTELRVFRIELLTNKWNDKLAESLFKLRKIQTLQITKFGSSRHNINGLDAWVTPRNIRTLETQTWCWFSLLPAWLNNSSLLLHLSILEIALRELRQDDLLILGRLPSLCYLNLEVDQVDLGTYGRFVVGAGLFPCLLRCWLHGFVAPVLFRQGAMPRLTMLDFDFHVGQAMKIAGSDGGFDLGLGNLLSLRRVHVWLQSEGTSVEEVEEVKAAVRKEAEIHPNGPTLELV